jgi:hypothetical protein
MRDVMISGAYGDLRGGEGSATIAIEDEVVGESPVAHQTIRMNGAEDFESNHLNGISKSKNENVETSQMANEGID